MCVKIFIISILFCFSSEVAADISIATNIRGNNITIYKDLTTNAAFDPKNVKESTCHPSPLFIENLDQASRTFFITNEDMSMDISINQQIVNLPANSTTPYTFQYQTHSLKWEYVYLNFNDVHFTYIKLCEKLEIPTHPIIILLSLAIILVLIGSIYGQQEAIIFGNKQQHEEIGTKSAIMFIVIASCGLMLLYFLKDYVQIVMLIWVICVGFTALQGLFSDILSLMKLENTSFYQLPVIGKVSEAKLVSSIAALLIVFGYFFTRNWLLSNAIAISITLFMFKLIEIDCLRTGTILLSLAFFYDIFWVFYSHYIFGESVMATVATSIDLPMKLQCPEIFSSSFPVSRCSILGLGDIVLPGIILKYLYKCSIILETKKPFIIGYVGYITGLLLCMLFLITFNVAQPALLYLTPSILLPVILLTYKMKLLSTIWSSNPGSMENIPTKNNQDYELAAGEI